ncbi:MAG: hypothetical protein FJX74_20400 [Armatimonadetes bacterium]|nr:hypothetical protein [Armatimonadota bacterium]
MRKKYVVQLSPEERERCAELVRSGAAPARTLMHARVLLKADSGPQGPGWTDAAIAEAVEVRASTVGKLRHARWERNLSPHPVAQYARDLRHWRATSNAGGCPWTPTPSPCRKLLARRYTPFRRVSVDVHCGGG